MDARTTQPNFTNRIWGPVVDAANVPEGLRIHDMRHTAAALTIAADPRGDQTASREQLDHGHDRPVRTRTVGSRITSPPFRAVSVGPGPDTPDRGPAYGGLSNRYCWLGDLLPAPHLSDVVLGR